MPQANLLAPVALLAWPVLCIALFAVFRPTVAGAVSIVGAGLLLPEGYAFDYEGLPTFNRETLAALAALAGILLFHRERIQRRLPPRGVEWLIVLLIAGGFLTALTNGDPRDIGARTLRGLGLWQGVSEMADAVLVFAAPFYVGRVLFRRPRELAVLLTVLAVAGLLYSLPILWEARMSPHLHYRLYGYQPAEFAMAKRELFFGWRPMVFVGHGLSLAMFAATAAVAATTLWRTGRRLLGGLAPVVAPYLAFILLVCNSLAAIAYGLVALPLAAFARVRLQRWAIAALAALILGYPALRAADLFPTETLVEQASAVSEARAQSLAFRFENEDMLLEHARERPLFGWGGHGRARVYDPDTGRDVSTSDGLWIIVLGQLGLVGFLASFGLLVLPVLAAVRVTRRRPVGGETLLVLGTAWVVALNVVDLLPNAFLTARTVFCAGALTGALQGWPAAARTTRRPPAPPRAPSPAAPARETPPSLAKGLRRRSRPPSSGSR